MPARQPRVHVADVVRSCWSSSRPCPCSWGRGARSRGGSRCRATSRCISAAASPPSTTPPPGMTRLGTPASAASWAKRAARSGLTARITVSGRSGRSPRRRVARLPVDLRVVGVDEVAARLAAHPRGGCRGPSSAERRPRAGADDRDRARREQRPQVDRGRGSLGDTGRRSPSTRQPTTAPTPRFSSARAMIEPLDLGRALPDPVDAQLAQVPLGGELAHVAAAAEHLDDPVRAAPRGLGGEQLGDRRALAWTTLGSAPAVHEPRGLARQQPRRRGVGRRVREREADALEVVDPLAELDPLGRPVDGQREQPLHRPRAAGADVEPLLDEPLVGQLVGLAHSAQHRVGRDADVAQHELRVAVGERVGVVRVAGLRQAGRVVVDEEQRRACRSSPSITWQWKIMKSVSDGPGDEPLLAVEHPLPGRRVADRGRGRASARRSPGRPP